MNWTINHRKWENKYVESASYYPSVNKYANMIASGITCDVWVEDEVIQTCLTNLIDENQQKMKGILFLLKKQHYSRLKQVAMLCVKQLPNYKLKQQAYKNLAEIKNDSDI
ncbi:hypothetical protein RBG61_09140 [Paludicola sp. MB14-C6]|uniref:hypothetical protein n=1 Tax=Paludihabitans sp. MB14-C6 TaxID=3070656 RepID=UPI0027DB32E6|nr:hypothetical protein [Paludicola sp. MB14-C6]WMJ22164.1 hypothetical protein RBG61_09140 [Paludicola sp. MB14-C6]